MKKYFSITCLVFFLIPALSVASDTDSGTDKSGRGYLLAVNSLMSSNGFAMNNTTNRYREPVEAFGLSFLYPGLGQFYNGQNLKGGLLAGGFTIAFLSYTVIPELSKKPSYGDREAVSLLAFMVIYLYSLIDAPVSAGRINRANTKGGFPLIETEHLGIGFIPYFNTEALLSKNTQQPLAGGGITICLK
jgi:hypothetical protein